MYKKLTKQALVYGLLLSSYTLNAQSPGGIVRQSLWLRGNFFSDTAHTRTLNFNPATNMDNISTGIKMPGDIQDLRRATIFTVYQSPGLGQDTSVWQMNGGFGDLLLSTRQVYSKSGKMNMVFEKTGTVASKPKKPEAIISTYLRQQVSQPVSEDAANKEAVIRFGNRESSNMGGQSPGLIAEFIVYETILKEKEIARIETYLALKYGITLEKDYLNSLGKTIWSRKNEEVYSNNIAGIGRDDHSTLYQKQGTSCSTTDQLIIGINKIASTNAGNTGQLNDRDYLIWGDNAQPFTLQQNPGPDVSDVLLSEKKWLMKSSGSTARTISTELKIDTKTLLPTLDLRENFCLAIDRSGSGDFTPKKFTCIMPDSISADGIASFSGIVWDTDGSGKDVFSFGLKTRLPAKVSTDATKLLSFHVYPNPISDGHYNVAVTLDKPTDINIKVYDIHLHLIESKKVAGQSHYLVSGNINTVSGAYIIKLFIPNKEFSQIIIKQ